MSLHYERSGAGEPVLLLHGLGGSGGLWRPVVERIGGRRDVIVPDLPGFGGSPVLDGGAPASPARLAEPMIELCSELGIERPCAVGNSLGAWVALEMAKRGAVSSVVGISPAGLWREPLAPRRVDSQAVGRRLRPVLTALLATKAGRVRVLGTSMAHPERVPPDAAREVVWSYIDAPGYAAANEAMRAGAFEHADLIDVPVTLVWGEEDRTLGRPSRTRMPPNASFFTMPGWGHTPTWDDPDGVAKLVLEASTGPLSE